mgnify:CR=1 FL=1
MSRHGGGGKDGCSKKSNFLWKFFHYFQVSLRSLPNQLMDQQYQFLIACGGCKEVVAFITFWTSGTCPVPEKVPNKLRNPICCLWAKFCFNIGMCGSGKWLDRKTDQLNDVKFWWRSDIRCCVYIVTFSPWTISFWKSAHIFLSGVQRSTVVQRLFIIQQPYDEL